MGWGMLAGVGQGLSNYSTILGEKRKQDFQLKRDELAFERSKSLKDLEFQNQSKRDKQGRRWHEDDRELARKRVLEDRAWSTAEEEKKRKQNLADQVDVYQQKKDIDAKYQDELLRQSYDFEKLKTDEQRLQTEKDLREGFMKDGEISTFEEMILLGAKTGTNVAQYFKPKDGKPLSAEMVQTISDVLMNNEDYQKLAQENPAAFFAMVPRMADLMNKREAKGGGDPDPKVVLNNVLGALDSGKETPDSLRRQAKTEEEKQLVETAINRWQISKQEDVSGLDAKRDDGMGFKVGPWAGALKESFSAKNTPSYRNYQER